MCWTICGAGLRNLVLFFEVLSEMFCQGFILFLFPSIKWEHCPKLFWGRILHTNEPFTLSAFFPSLRAPGLISRILSYRVSSIVRFFFHIMKTLFLFEYLGPNFCLLVYLVYIFNLYLMKTEGGIDHLNFLNFHLDK